MILRRYKFFEKKSFIFKYEYVSLNFKQCNLLFLTDKIYLAPNTIFIDRFHQAQIAIIIKHLDYVVIVLHILFKRNYTSEGSKNQ